MEAAGKFGLYMLAARVMGGTESGLFFLCLTWVNLCTTLARMGLERAMSRHIAAELAIGKGTAARRVLVGGLGWTLLASTAAGVVTFALSTPVAVLVFGQPELAHPLAIAALILPPQTMAFAIGFALIGLNRGVAGQMVQSALPPVLSLIALVAGLNHIDLVLTVYAGSYTVCCVLGLGFIAWDWRHVMVDRFVAAAATAEPLPTLWVTARPFLVIEMVQVSLLSAPVLMLGVVGDPASVSAFSIVSRLTMLINTILISVAMIAAPAFASHHRRQEYRSASHRGAQHADGRHGDLPAGHRWAGVVRPPAAVADGQQRFWRGFGAVRPDDRTVRQHLVANPGHDPVDDGPWRHSAAAQSATTS